MSAAELLFTKTGSWLLLTVFKSKRPSPSGTTLAGIWGSLKTKPLGFVSPGVKLRMPGAGGSSWGSTSWSAQRWQRGSSPWRGSTGMRTFATRPTASWTTTLRWWRLPPTSTHPTSFVTPACRASRPASIRVTTAGWRAGGTPEVSGGEREVRWGAGLCHRPSEISIRRVFSHRGQQTGAEVKGDREMAGLKIFLSHHSKPHNLEFY